MSSTNASAFLEAFFEERCRRMSAPSPLGGILERARDGIPRGNVNLALHDERNLRYAMAVKVWASLSKLQQAVCFLHHAPVGPAEYVKAWRAIFADELVNVGGRLRGPRGGDPIAAVGPQVVIETREIRVRTPEEIGNLLNLSPTKAAKELKRAFRVVESHPLYKALQDDE